MKQNTFITFGVLAFLVLLSVGFASAISAPNFITLSATQGFSNSTTFILTNNETANWNTISIDSLSPVIFTVSPTAITSLNVSNSTTINVTANNSLGVGSFSGNLSITYNNSSITLIKLIPVTVTISQTTSTITFCTLPSGTNLSITEFEINNNGEGDEVDWYFLDNFEINVEVRNDGTKKVSDVNVQIAVYSGAEDVTRKFDFEDTKISLGSISDDDEETAMFVLNSLPVDLEEGDYTIYVKAYSNYECDSKSDLLSVSNPFGEGVIVYGGALDMLTDANAGEYAEVTLDVINLGSSKEKEVLVTLYNKELGIDEKYNLNDLGSGDSETITFPLINVPANAQSKTYKITVETYFNYDEGDVLEESSYDGSSYDDLEDDFNTFSLNMRVIGGIDTTKPTISATLNSTAKVGEELVINLAIKNNANVANSFIISADEYSSWAEFVGINPSLMTISAQGTGSAILKLKPTESGQQTFNVRVVYNGKTIDQPVTVNVAPSTSGLGFLNNLVDQFGKTTAYLIVAIVILVAIILLVLIVKLIIYLIRKI